MRNTIFPIVLIILGIAWLLDSFNWLPQVHWLWIFGLSGAGVVILWLDGVNKSSIVVGPLLILAGFLSFVRQYFEIGWRHTFPVMLIAAGVLMLVARAVYPGVA
jgi:hypothetical protein